MNFKFYLFIINIFILIKSEIITIKSFEEVSEILQNSDADTLIIFDVDRTLIIPEENAFRYPNLPMILGAIDNYYQKTNHTNHFVKLAKIATNYKHIILESCIINIINNLQNKNAKLIALTDVMTEPDDIVDWKILRFNQLKELDIDFSTSFQEESIILDNLPVFENNYPLFNKGMLLANNIAKGKVLTEFLNKIKWQPKKIIFFDDRETNLTSVENALTDLDPNIIFKGYHYIKADLIDNTVDKEIFEQQINHLVKYGYWLQPQDLQSAFLCDEII